MSDERSDVMMDVEDLYIENDDIVIIKGVAVIIQNLTHRLIEDGRIYHLFKGPTDKTEEILDHCVGVLEQDDDVIQHTFGWSRNDNLVTFSGKLVSGAIIDLPWVINDDN